MPTVHLTDIAVRQLKSPGIYFDDALSNFGVSLRRGPPCRMRSADDHCEYGR